MLLFQLASFSRAIVLTEESSRSFKTDRWKVSRLTLERWVVSACLVSLSLVSRKIHTTEIFLVVHWTNWRDKDDKIKLEVSQKIIGFRAHLTSMSIKHLPPSRVESTQQSSEIVSSRVRQSPLTAHCVSTSLIHYLPQTYYSSCQEDSTFFQSLWNISDHCLLSAQVPIPTSCRITEYCGQLSPIPWKWVWRKCEQTKDICHQSCELLIDLEVMNYWLVSVYKAVLLYIICTVHRAYSM